jgi:hypothetical protein
LLPPEFYSGAAGQPGHFIEGFCLRRVDLIEMVEDDDEFGIIIEDVGQALSLLRSRAVQSHWLRNLRAG